MIEKRLGTKSNLITYSTETRPIPSFNISVLLTEWQRIVEMKNVNDMMRAIAVNKQRRKKGLGRGADPQGASSAGDGSG